MIPVVVVEEAERKPSLSKVSYYHTNNLFRKYKVGPTKYRIYMTIPLKIAQHKPLLSLLNQNASAYAMLIENMLEEMQRS